MDGGQSLASHNSPHGRPRGERGSELVIPAGSVVQLQHAGGMNASAGALAEVVDGVVMFPELFEEMEELIPEHHDRRYFVWIRWLREDPRWGGQPDGAYWLCRFNPHPVLPVGPRVLAGAVIQVLARLLRVCASGGLSCRRRLMRSG